MQKAIVEIKKPCSVDLKSMDSDASGKLCQVCQTRVIDFTKKSPNEIALYFQLHKSQKNCGIFNNSILKTENKLDNLISRLHSKELRLLALFITGLLIFAGCKTKKHTGTTYGTPRFLDEKTNSIENIK
jgi:hypothetical protein